MEQKQESKEKSRKFVSLFTEFLQNVKEQETICHAIFSCGTVVSFPSSEEKAKIPEGWTYNPESENYPTHRITDKKLLLEIFETNKNHYQDLLKRYPSSSLLIQKAWYELIHATYPYPGNYTSDTVTNHVLKSKEKEHLWMTIFPELNPFIGTLSITTSKDQLTADLTGREGRRLDYMSPKMVAIIQEKNCTLFDV